MTPAAPNFRVLDRTSDGMCGSITVTDGRRTERVSWSVTDPSITSQHAAMEEAVRRLRGPAPEITVEITPTWGGHHRVRLLSRGRVAAACLHRHRTRAAAVRCADTMARELREQWGEGDSDG
jgi:hypothetical protein